MKFPLTFVCLMFFLNSLFGSNSYEEAKLIQIEGFIDIDYRIAAIERNDDGTIRFIAKGSLNGKNTGLAVELSPSWEKQPIEEGDEKNYFYWGSGRILSLGEDSTRFVAILSHLYGLEKEKRTALEAVDCQVVGLASDPRRFEEEKISMKFFLNSEADEDFYAEVFINLDTQNQILEFHEKDTEYRAPLIRSLSTELRTTNQAGDDNSE